jgi:peptidoglycan L-alanyl-D-glutamate endopeptidase CwlK
MAENMVADCKRHGIDIMITSTYRDNESQAALYAIARTAPGARTVTNAKPGQSFHNYRCAFDVVPIVNGKPFWDTKSKEGIAFWNKIGAIGEACGLEWAGRWVTFKEFAHFQYTGGLTLKDLQAGKRIV